MTTRSGISYSPKIESTRAFVVNDVSDFINTITLMITLCEKLGDTKSRIAVIHVFYTNLVLDNIKWFAVDLPAFKKLRLEIYKNLDEISRTEPTFRQYKRKIKRAYAKLGAGPW